MEAVTQPRKYYLISIFTFICSVVNVYAVKGFMIFGSPLLFGIALLVEAVLLIVFIYSIIRALSAPQNIIWSLFVSARSGLATNDYIKKLGKSKSPILLWTKRRLKQDSPTGRPLTITLMMSLLLFCSFLGVLLKVIAKGSLVHADLRILNLVPSIRTTAQTTFFRVVTSLANTETAILLMVATAAIFWRKHKRLLAGVIVAVSAGEEAITYSFKLLVHRLRPDMLLRLIQEDSYSFPSGHAVRATVLFGLLAYFIYKSYTSTRARILTVSLYFLAVFLVATSRIYLAVHYPSDVWASFLLGTSMLVIVIGGLEIGSRYKLAGHKKIDVRCKTVAFIPLLLMVFSVASSSLFVRIRPVILTPAFTTVQNLDEATIHKLPLYSETLTGDLMEPINFVYVGYQDQIESTFLNHGWFVADTSTLGNTLRAVAVGFQGREYLNAPVTPSFLNFKPQNVAFEQSTATHSLKQRHHTRLWRTDYATADGQPIWVATASFDEGIEFAGAAKLPTHHINPNIDAERAYIIQSLGLSSNLIQVVGPQLGHNASGDDFFTDGKAEVINIKKVLKLDPVFQ